MVDATIVAVPRHAPRARRVTPSSVAKRPRLGRRSQAKNRQKDKDARWTGNSFYVYKNHVNADGKHKLIRRYAVSDAVFDGTSGSPFDLTGKRVFVAGHNGMAGSAIVRRLKQEPCAIVTADRQELDLSRQEESERFLAVTRPDVVVIAAGRVGGIKANSSFPVEFLADNLAIELNLIRASHDIGVEKLLFLGSTCVYPRFAKQPISEDQLLTGPLEATNQWYAIAKIAGIKLCEAYRLQYGRDFISVMPTNLFGPGDNYHSENSHVAAALVRRFHEAKIARTPTVTVWGTGTQRREFLYVDDLADACVFILKHYSNLEFVNIGCGEDLSIADFAQIVAETVGYDGQIIFDPSKPDGTPRKLVDISRLSALGWKATTTLREGLRKAYSDFLAKSIRER